MKKKQSKFGYLVMGVGVLVLGGWLLSRSGFGAESVTGIEGVAVKRGPLKISVVERGDLKAIDSVDLASEIEGSTTVLWLIDEGVMVETGDRVCELDTSGLVERRVSQEISVQNTEAAYVKGQQNLAIQESQNESDIKRGERDLLFAKADLAKYLNGDWPQEKQAAEEEIIIATEELTRARTELEWSRKLFKKGFLEQTQLDADSLSETRSEIRLKQVTRALQLLEEYDFPRKRDEFDADVDERERELVRIKLQARARLVDYEANERTTKARFDLETEKLAKLDSQIEKAILHAPVAGMVVYAIEERGRWGGGEPMQEGASVRERQKIITIPSSGGFIAETSLHESVLEMVNVSQPCIITVDALSELSFSGRVKFKAILPDQQSWYANPDLRVYRTEVQLLTTDARLRPGMSCSVEILVDQLEDTLHIPVQSVFLDGGEPVCFVSKAKGTEKRAVEVGRNNGRFVAIESGLREDEIVCMAQPAGIALAPAKQKESSRMWEGPPPVVEGLSPGGRSGAAGGRPAGREAGGGRASMGRGQMRSGDGKPSGGRPRGTGGQ